MNNPYAFCHYCGTSAEHAIRTNDGIRCNHCNETMWLNSVGVAVLIAPCGHHESGREHGVFIQKRGIEPARGEWALPSGYVMRGETWEAAACREASEEINIVCRYNHSTFEKPYLIGVYNSSDLAKVIIVGAVHGVFYIGDFTPNTEVLERDVLFPDDTRQLCFPIHRQALAKYWDSLNVAHTVQV